MLARLVPAAAEELSSQRFWDHMHLFEADHFAPIQRGVARRIRERFPLGEQFLVYDTTNYYTFIHTFNSRPSLPQRGRNKQKRADLRQLSLALVVDEERGLPLYYRCYEGNVTDVVALGASLAGDARSILPSARFSPPHADPGQGQRLPRQLHGPLQGPFLLPGGHPGWLGAPALPGAPCRRISPWPCPMGGGSRCTPSPRRGWWASRANSW